ncbi:hypothetical protein CK203_048086 [Vitis vinifera]|uniref:DUF4283 domain-containing protein n=1 Tax=Vitis vinifera TaxID=29760 RepID=A0A438GYU8_VITVI|nr:hypothetical protein CK203_048086 [Vitis vinifera]
MQERERERERARESAMVRRGGELGVASRRKECSFTVESKAFEIVVEDRRGKIQGLIVEKKGGTDGKGMEGAGENVFYDSRENRAGGFIRLGVSDIEGRENQKGKAVEKAVVGRSYATMVTRTLSGNPNVIAVKGEDDLEKLGQFWAKSWDLKSRDGRNQVRLEHWSPRSGCWAEEEERKEVGILVRLRGEFRPSMLEIEVEEEIYAVSLWWECWPVLRRKRRNEAGHSSEVRGEEVSRAGQRVMKDG